MYVWEHGWIRTFTTSDKVIDQWLHTHKRKGWTMDEMIGVLSSEAQAQEELTRIWRDPKKEGPEDQPSHSCGTRTDKQTGWTMKMRQVPGYTQAACQPYVLHSAKRKYTYIHVCPNRVRKYIIAHSYTNRVTCNVVGFQSRSRHFLRLFLHPECSKVAYDAPPRPNIDHIGRSMGL